MEADTSPTKTEEPSLSIKKAIALKELQAKYFSGRWYLVVVSSIFLVSFFVSTINIPLNYDSSHKPYFTYDELEVNERLVKESFGFKTRQGGNKVFVVVLDGLRYDFLSNHGGLGKLMQDIEADSRKVLLRAQLPSISHPNWATLLTSARPQFTGVTSNNNGAAMYRDFDHIFKRAQQAGLKRGIVGDEQWLRFVHDSLATDGFDGTIFNVREDPNEATFRHEAGHNFDEASFQVVDRVLKKQGTGDDFDLFWAYFQDIDSRSHQTGPFSDKAMSAANNISNYLRNIIDRLNQDTVLVITADHGHVDAGGHGGTEESVLQVPFVLYKKGSGIGKVPVSKLWQPEGVQPTNLEFAPTICGLLGVPVPQQSEGRKKEN